MMIQKTLIFFFFSTMCLILVIGKVDFYKGQSPASFVCNVDLHEPFSCICLYSGLWKIYSSCLEFYFVGVKNKYCFNPREMIRRVEQSFTNSSAKLVLSSSKRTIEFNENFEQILEKDELLITQRQITIADGRTSICLAAVPKIVKEHYCIYEVNDLLHFIRSVKDGCEEGSLKLMPKECHEVIADEPVCPDLFEGENDLHDLKRTKRMFPPLAVNKTPFADTSEPDDEDYWNAAAGPKENPYGAELGHDADDISTPESPIILSEIWNYLDQQLDEVLELNNFESPSSVVETKIPIFIILNLCKQVMLKTCPSYYVGPAFIDLVVDSFTSVLVKRNYLDEFQMEFEGLNRFVTTLTNCILNSNVTEFPFIDETAHSVCESHHDEKTRVGAYEIFGNKTDLNVPEIYESWHYEPIIDSVWKIFANAYHSCFAFFSTTHNDIFRFITIVESLFQGEVHDIWMSGNTTQGMMGGFLGNIKEITENLTYCMVSSGLETKSSWNLNRPTKIEGVIEKRVKREAAIAIGDNSGSATCYTNKQCIDSKL